MRHPSEYKLTLLPPSPDTDGLWYGYAQDTEHPRLVDGHCDPTPDNVKAHGETADGVACDLWWSLQNYVEKINGEEALAFADQQGEEMARIARGEEP